MSIHQNSKLSKHEQSKPIYIYPAMHKPSKHTTRHTEAQAGNSQLDENGNLRVINDSMIELQDPAFVQNEIDDFQTRLQIATTHRGFCKVTRDQSLLLSNTEGYRKYKNNMSLYRSRSKQSISKENQAHQFHEKPILQSTKVCGDSEQNGNKIQKKQSQVSLTYSNESQVRGNKDKQRIERREKITNKSSILPELMPNQLQQNNN